MGLPESRSSLTKRGIASMATMATKALAGAAMCAAPFVMPIAAIADMVGHGGMIRSIAVSPDGQYALTASFDYSARLWRFDEQRELQVLDGHDGPVNGAIFSRHKDRLVTVGADGKVIIWDRLKAEPLVVMNGHRGRAMSVVETADSGMILTGGWDGRLIVWDLHRGTRVKVYETGVPMVSAALSNPRRGRTRRRCPLAPL